MPVSSIMGQALLICDMALWGEMCVWLGGGGVGAMRGRRAWEGEGNVKEGA